MDLVKFMGTKIAPQIGHRVTLNLEIEAKFSDGMDSPAPTIDPKRFYLPRETQISGRAGTQVQGYIAEITENEFVLCPEWDVQNDRPNFRAGGFQVTYNAIHSISNYSRKTK